MDRLINVFIIFYENSQFPKFELELGGHLAREEKTIQNSPHFPLHRFSLNIEIFFYIILCFSTFLRNLQRQTDHRCRLWIFLVDADV